MVKSMTILVMKKTMPARPGALRVSIAGAKSQLSRLIREAERQPVVIQNRGRDVATLVVGTAQPQETPFVDFFARLDARAVLRPKTPFGDE